MVAINTDTFLDDTARAAGVTFEIGNKAKLTVRTDSRIHAGAPASMTGSLGNPTFTDIGGEHIIDASAVRWLAFNTGSSTVPAIGTIVTQDMGEEVVSGYLLGVWPSMDAAPLAVGAAMPATGFIKFREVTGGTFVAGALTGITASATSADVTGWIEVVYDSGVNFVVPRVGKFKTRGGWFELGTTNGTVGQVFTVPSTSSHMGLNYGPGVWIETDVASTIFEFWPALNGQANGWSYRHIGYPSSAPDKRGKFVSNLFGNGKIQIGKTYNLKATYASVAAQAGTYAGITVAATYTWAGDVLTVDCGANLHYLEVGLQCGFDFTSGSGVDQILTVSKVIDAFQFECVLSGSGTGGAVTLRPGVTVTFTAHGLNIGMDVGCDFTSGTGADGIYKVYRLDSANAYRVSYPHLTALTGGNVSCLHTLQLTVPTDVTVTDVALSGTYTCAGNLLTVTAAGHQCLAGMIVGVDFTSGGLGTDGNYQIISVTDANTFVCYCLTASAVGGNCVIRPGVSIALTAHQKQVGESQYYNFAATVTDGDYPVYVVDSADAYKINVPHLTAYAGTTVGLEHGLAVGNRIYIDFITGGATDGTYTVRATAATTININYGHLTAITTSNCYIRQTEGYIPPSGCRVRIPNIIMTEATTALRSLNQVPNTTVASRPRFTTTAAGALDIEYLYGMSAATNAIGQAYQCKIHASAFHDSINISEVATPLDIYNIGVGMYSAQDMRSLVFTSCFAGGTIANCVAMRGNTPGGSDHSFEMLYCKGQTVSNIRSGIIQFARNTGVVNINACQDLTFNNFMAQAANILVTSCNNIVFNNTDYCDRIIGRTNTTTPLYAFVISAACNNIMLDGLSFGLINTLVNCHPYSGLVSFAASNDLKFRNFGTYAAPLNLGDWEESAYNCNTPLVSVGNNNTVKMQRIFLTKCRYSLMTTLNSDKNVTYEHIDIYPYFYGSGTGNPKIIGTTMHASLNGTCKALTSGGYPTTAQTSVYGSHWIDMFKGDTLGGIILMMNEPTAETASYFSLVAGNVKFNSSGGVEMRSVNDQAIWEMPYFAQGHTGFVNTAAVMSGGTIGNYTLEYQIDTGSGWNGAWKTLSGANLSAETVVATTGFKLKIRITTGTGNSTAITFLRIITTSTSAAQAAINYELDDPVTVTVNVKDVVSGSDIQDARVLLLAAAGGSLPSDATVTIVNSGTTATVTHASHGMKNLDKVQIKGASLAANNGVYTINLINTGSYSYTMGSAPGSSPTGTIKATYVAISDVTNSSGNVSMSRIFSAAQPVTGRVRKATSPGTLYKTGAILGTVSATAGFSTVIQLIPDA